jgi:hypothetical protein
VGRVFALAGGVFGGDGPAGRALEALEPLAQEVGRSAGAGALEAAKGRTTAASAISKPRLI